MSVVNFVKTFVIGFVCLHFSYAAAVSESLLNSSYDRIKTLANQVHRIAKSTSTTMEKRLVDTEHEIKDLQKLLDTQELLPFQKRYLLLLECFAWDVFNRLKESISDQLFDMESDIKRQAPSTQIRCQNFYTLIEEDIKNVELKRILSEMANASNEQDTHKYELLASELESLGHTLSGAEKKEFDLYRMILGPQVIIIPD